MKKLVINQRDYNGIISKICRDIAISKWRPDYVVGITKDGIIPALYISEYFGIPVDFFNENTSYCGMAEDAYGLETSQYNILVVDGINNDAEVFSWIKNDWASLCFPKNTSVWEKVWGNNVKFAAMVNDSASKFKELDYYGTEINSIEEPIMVEFPNNLWWVK
jgi:hypoxanthine phosphoribosyltransferase